MIIYFPAGIYYIASYTTTSNYLKNFCLLLHSNLDIMVDGDQTVIRLADHIFDKKIQVPMLACFMEVKL